MRIKDLEDGSKILDFQSPKMKDVVEFVKTLNKIYEDGYIIDEDFSPRQCPQIFRFLGVKFIKKENNSDEVSEDIVKEIVEIETGNTNDKEISIDDITKKEDLLNFAEKNGIKIPEDIVYPMSIKKYLKENIGSK